jgi:hypothetical protein
MTIEKNSYLWKYSNENMFVRISVIYIRKNSHVNNKLMQVCDDA